MGKHWKVLFYMGLGLALMTAQAFAEDNADQDVAQADAKDGSSKNSSEEQKQGQTAKKSKKKSTEVSFEDVLVQGKYHFSDEAVTTVEDDKILDALLGVRTDFKDRLKRSAARH